MSDPTDIAARRQAGLLAVLACPICRSQIEFIDAVWRSGAIAKADILCPNCGVVGLINAYRPSFLARDREDPGQLPGLVPEWVPLTLSSLVTSGQWSAVPEGLLGLGLGVEIGGLVFGSGIRFELLTHAWSCRVELRFEQQSAVLDLRTDEPGTRVVVFSGEDNGEHAWSVTVLDEGTSGVAQVIIRDIFQYVEASSALPAAFKSENRGNPYPARLEEILCDLPLDAVVLDLGGGDRLHPDPRVLNLEYLPYRRVDLYADGLQLPFIDGAFDFIMSQAVLEHVPDPPKAVDEIRRVLKPGGLVYAEFAFMQPLHAVPFHFYNITPHGAALLFEAFDDVDISWFGGLADTMRWFFRLMKAEQKIGTDAVDAVLEGLDNLDAKLSNRELSMLASAVAVEARAPSAD